MPSPELKPCPWCKGRAVVQTVLGTDSRVLCHPSNQCDIHPVSPWFRSREEAVAAWNRRAEKGTDHA